MTKRVLAVVMSLLLMLPASGIAAFADEGDGQDSQDGLTTTNPADDATAEEVVQEVIADRGNLAAGTYYFQFAPSSVMRMLAYDGKSNVLLAVATGKQAQQWSVVIGKDGYAHLKNVKSGKVLSVSGGVAAEGAAIVQAAEKPASDPNAPGSKQQYENLDQKWVVKKTAEQYAFVSALDDKFALTIAAKSASPAYKAELKAFTGGSRQLFATVAPSAVKQTISNRSNIAKGVYYIQSSYVSTHVLGSKGTNARLTTTAGTGDQRWKLTVGRDGYAKLTNVSAKKVLTVRGGKAVKGANVCLRAEKAPVDAAAAGTVLAQENLYQKWVVKKKGKKLLIVSALNGKYALQIANSKKGYNAELQKLNGSSARQQFSFIASKPTAAKKGKRTVANGIYMLAPTSRATQVVSIAGSSKKSGANARISAFAATAKQTFKVTYDKHGFYTVTNVYSGKQLAPAAKCSVPGINVGQYKLGKSSLDRGKWRIDKSGSGYRLVNKATGLALEMADVKHPNGTNVCASTSVKGRKAQRFSLVRPCDLSPAASQVRGIYYIVMNSSEGYAIGIQDESRIEGASVTTRLVRNTNLQRFVIKSAGAGTYYLSNFGTDRVVSLEQQSKDKGTNVVMRDNNGSLYQQWKVVYNDDFTYAFENAYSGMHLHVASAAPGDNANIVAYSARTSSANQAFKLVATSPVVESAVLNVPCYLQNPELPTGCESVALTNAIRYWGFNLSKTEIADRWMPYGSDGVYNFIGNPRNSSGWIICAPGIANTANSYLRHHGASVSATVVKGSRLSKLQRYICRGCPVVVWTTIGMGSPGTVQWWNSGYPLRSNNHAVVLCGYNPHNGKYLVADSLAGTVWRDGSRFESIYNEMGRQAVVIGR